MNFLRRLTGQKTGTAPKPGSQEVSKPQTPDDTGSSVGVQLTDVASADSRAPQILPPAPSAEGSASPVTDSLLTASTPVANPLFGATKQLSAVELEQAAGGLAPGKYLSYGLKSDVGMVRTNNQDSLLAFFSISMSVDDIPNFGLFVVADGMGGHHEGERASAIATRTIANHITGQFYMRLIEKTYDSDGPIISEVLTDAVQKANAAVSKEIPEGGTTVTAAAVVGDMVYIAHVGDSRAYMITTDGLDQLTRDHSLVQRLIELDQLTPEEASVHPQKNVLYRAIGQSDHIEIDTVTRRLPPGGRLLLCSDGLWNVVPEDRLLHLATTARSPQDACEKLVHAANERGGQDNITVIVVLAPA